MFKAFRLWKDCYSQMKNKSIKAILIFWLALIVLFAFTSFIVFASTTLSNFIVLPKIKMDKLKKIPQRTKIYADDGSLLAVFYKYNRENIKLEDVPENVIKATVAIEDQRFFSHEGVDFKSIGRALVTNLKYGRIVEGGSTITQQLVKNLFLTNEKTLERKIKEAILAYQLEHRLSKKKILELYLNTVYYGEGAYGIKAAAELYFGKQPKDLTLSEAALLAGLPKGPSRFSPYQNPDQSQARKNQVLKKMVKLKFITPTQKQLALAEPLNLRPRPTANWKAPHFVEYIRQTIIKRYGGRFFYEGGLNIYTSLNPKMQQAAEKAIETTLNRPGDPSAALVSIESKTGFIKALVGGRQFEASQFNLAVQGRRQAGSAFKTFVLVTALAKGIPPSTVFSGSSPIVLDLGLGEDWKVENFGNTGYGPLPVVEATVKSVNVVYAQLILRVGAANVARMAQKMGIKSPVDALPAIALGGLSKGVSPLDMASAYSTLANKGVHYEPNPITKITTTSGKVIYKAKPNGRRVLDEKVAQQATDILQEVIKRGTGTRANIGRPAAGKTGTSENLSDAWFCGYTPELTTVVWVGYPDKRREMRNVHGIQVVGGSFPAEIWRKFMLAALAGKPVSQFEASPPSEPTPSPEPAPAPLTPRKVIPMPQPMAPVPPPVNPSPPSLPSPTPAPTPEQAPTPAPAPAPAPEPVKPPEQQQPKPTPSPPPSQPTPTPSPSPSPEPAPEQPPPG